MNTRRNRTLSLLAASALIGSVAPATNADSYLVTSILDSGPGTLRAAIEAANAHPGADTICFHDAISGTIALPTAVSVIDSVTIIGKPGGAIRLTSGPGFLIAGQTEVFGMVDIECYEMGSVIRLQKSARLNLQRCTFRSNGVLELPSGVIYQAGYHAVSGVINACSFIENRGHSFGVGRIGVPEAGLALDVTNCTFSGNQGNVGPAVFLIGHSSPNVGQIRVRNCTVTGNHSGASISTGRGAFHLDTIDTQQPVMLMVRNTVLADNTSQQNYTDTNFSSYIPGTYTLEGVNVFTAEGLDPLERISGQFVRAPRAGSALIDAAAADNLVSADQLGRTRPVVVTDAQFPSGFEGADIGAIEFIPALCAADFDRSGTVAVPDIFAFLSAWFAGCP